MNEHMDNHDQEDPTQALLRILHGDTDNLHIPHKTIVTGKKIKNTTLRKFVDKFRRTKKLNEEQLVNVLLAFDEIVEKEKLTEEVLENIRKNPEVLKKYLTKKKDDKSK